MKVLLIVEFIAPVNAVSAIRWTKLTKYLTLNHGYEIDILTNAKSYDLHDRLGTFYKYDETLAQDLKYFNEIHTFKDTLAIKATNFVRNWAKQAQTAANRIRHKLASNISAKAESSTVAPTTAESQATDKSEKASKLEMLYGVYEKIREHSMVSRASKSDLLWDEYDVIISSYSPKWAHLAAKRIKEEHPDIKWIADYRDPLVHSKRTMTVENINFPRIVTGQADCVFTVSPIEDFVMNIADGQRHEVISNGFDDEETTRRSRKKSSHFIIAYTGTLYNDGDAKSDLRPLLRALSELISEGKINNDYAKIVYCGPNEGLFLRQIAPYNNINWESRGMISRKEAMELQNESALLAMCAWNTEQERGTGGAKIFEYFTSGVPILCLCSGNLPYSPAKTMIDKSGTGFCYEEACTDKDYPKLKEYLNEKYQEWVADRTTTYIADSTYIESFSHRKLSDKVDKVIRSL